jgi:hypothetical protein
VIDNYNCSQCALETSELQVNKMLVGNKSDLVNKKVNLSPCVELRSLLTLGWVGRGYRGR